MYYVKHNTIKTGSFMYHLADIPAAESPLLAAPRWAFASVALPGGQRESAIRMW